MFVLVVAATVAAAGATPAAPASTNATAATTSNSSTGESGFGPVDSRKTESTGQQFEAAVPGYGGTYAAEGGTTDPPTNPTDPPAACVASVVMDSGSACDDGLNNISETDCLALAQASGGVALSVLTEDTTTGRPLGCSRRDLNDDGTEGDYTFWWNDGTTNDLGTSSEFLRPVCCSGTPRCVNTAEGTTYFGTTNLCGDFADKCSSARSDPAEMDRVEGPSFSETLLRECQATCRTCAIDNIEVLPLGQSCEDNGNGMVMLTDDIVCESFAGTKTEPRLAFGTLKTPKWGGGNNRQDTWRGGCFAAGNITDFYLNIPYWVTDLAPRKSFVVVDGNPKGHNHMNANHNAICYRVGAKDESGGGGSKAKKKLSGGESAAIGVVAAVLLIAAANTLPVRKMSAAVARAASRAVEAIKSVFGREQPFNGGLDASLM